VTVTAGSIVLRNNAQISSNTNTSGDAGSVVVTATGSILIDGAVHTLGTDFTGIASVANDTGEFTFSRAGSVTVNVGGDLVLVRNGQIATDTYTNGDAGAITITVGGALVIDGNGQLGKITGIFSDSFVAAGNAGTINITAGAGRLSNASKIATETAADGRGGDINALFGTLQIDTGASISSTSSDKGNAGSVTVRSPGTITLMDLSTAIQSRATGTGDAGPVTIFADTLVLKNNAAITTEATIGGGGNITLIVNQLLYLLNASVTTTVAGGSGSGGDIFIDPIFVVLNHSTILARAFQGNGGNITINTQYFLASPDSIVDASSALGVSGQVSISSPDTDLTSGLAQLPGGLLSTQTLEQRACVAPGETPTLSLVPTGRGGLALVLDESQSQPAFIMAGRPSLKPAQARADAPQLAQFKALPKAAPSSITCLY
jgi:large exoprotein involved in heme utilization and adhesion